MKNLTTNLGVVGIILISCATLNAQIFTVQSGDWNSPLTWSSGIVPDASFGSITINHKINVSSGALLTVDELILNDTVRIELGSIVILNNGTATDLQVLAGGLKVYGKLICRDGATFSGTTNANTVFYDDSTYEHQYFSSATPPPLAYWSINSNLEITGYTTSRSLSDALWSQSFGNVIYNCAGQSSFVSLGGRIKTIKGNFLILNTNGSVLRLSEDQATPTTMTIGGNFVIDGNSAVWGSREATISVFVAHDFKMLSTAGASSYLTSTGHCEVNVQGNFEMNSTSILRFASGTEFGIGILRVNKDFLFTAGTIRVSDGNGVGTLEMNGSSSQSFSSFGSWTSGVNLFITNATGVNIQNNSKVEGNVTVAPNGKLILPETNFILHGDIIVQTGGSIKSNHGTLILAGSVDQSLALNGDTLHHIGINKSQGTSITFSNVAKLSGTFSVLSTNTIVNSNGSLTLLSLSDDGNADASIGALPTGSSVLGNVTVQRYMSGEGRMYRYISSPVNNASVDSLMDDFPITGTFNDPSIGPGIRSSSPSFFYYDETLVEPLGWTAYPSSGFASENFIGAGKGYAAYIREASNATTWDVTGVLNQGDVPLPITFTDTGNPANDGWNLVGNPYPSSIQWNVVNGWDKINVDNGIAIRDNSIGGFLYWDGEIGNLGSGRIAKGQSFWIKTNNLDPQLTIKEIAKTSIASAFYRERVSEPDYVEVTINNTKQDERTYLRLRDRATSGYDSLDVVKFSNDFINLSFEVNKTSLAISAIPELDCSQLHPLNLSFAKNSNGSFVQSPFGNYVISVNAFGLFDVKEIILHDSFANLDVNLKTSPYSFLITEDSASFKGNRFSLLFKAPVLNDSASILFDSVLCDTSTSYGVQLKNAQPNTRYKILIDNQEADDSLVYQNNSISFEIKSKELNDGFTAVKVKASNLCYTKDIKEFNVWKQHTYAPDLTADLACNSETTTLHIKNAKNVAAFKWYDNNHTLLAQTRDSSFVTAIQKPTTFYAASVFDHGCVSDQSSAYADVVRYNKPVITEDHGFLYSNYSNNNRWSLNGEEVPGANQSTFKPTITGNYVLTIIHEGCVDSAFYYFIYQDDDVHVFPNPVEDEVQIVAPRDEHVTQIEVINASGQSIGILFHNQVTKAQTISMKDLVPGIYTLTILTTKNRYIMRFSKK